MLTFGVYFCINAQLKKISDKKYKTTNVNIFCRKNKIDNDQPVQHAGILQGSVAMLKS